MSKYVLALDQGTTSSRAIVFDRDGRAVATAQQEFPQIFPGPGHVEHDPEAIWSSQLATAKEAMAKAGRQRQRHRRHRRHQPARDHDPVGRRRRASRSPTRSSGRAASARRSASGSRRTGTSELFRRADRPRRRRLLLGHQDQAPARHDPRPARARGDGRDPVRHRRHVPDLAAHGRRACTSPIVSNASRTLLFNIHTLQWDDELLELLDVPRAMLPEVRASSEVYGQTDADAVRRGRSRSPATRATSRRRRSARPASTPGSAKNTYGTGCFMLLNTGEQAGAVGERTADDGGAGRSAARSTYASKAPSSSRARSCSGCATG